MRGPGASIDSSDAGGIGATGGLDSLNGMGSHNECTPDAANCSGAATESCDAALNSRASCGACNVVCGVTEYCGVGGCVQPVAGPHLALGALVRDFVFEPSGSGYLTGSFSEPYDFGGGVIDPGGPATIFIAKYTASRTLEWIKTLGAGVPNLAGNLALPGSAGIAIALDEVGNVYVTGQLHGAVDFGGGLVGDVAADATEVYAAGGSVFIASYDETGAFRWASAYKSALVKGLNSGTGLAVRSGVVYMAGDGVRGLDLGGGTIGNLQNDHYLFLAAFEASTGTHEWSKGLPYDIADGNGIGTITKLVVDSQARLYVSGWWRGQLDFGTGPRPGGSIVSLGNRFLTETGFVASYTSTDGTLRWVHVQNDDDFCTANALAIDEGDNVYAVGSFIKPMDFGGGVRDPSYVGYLSSSLFVVSYDSNGGYRFDVTGRNSSGLATSSATGIGVHQGKLYVSATYTGPADVGGAVLSSTPQGTNSDRSSADVALVSYDALTAEFRWARHFGTGESDLTFDVAMSGPTPVFSLLPQGVLEVDGATVEPLGTTTSTLIRVAE